MNAYKWCCKYGSCIYINRTKARVLGTIVIIGLAAILRIILHHSQYYMTS